MSKGNVVFAVTLLLCSGQVAANAADNTGPWHLSDVVKRADDHVNDKDTAVNTARLELQMLEALAKTHVDFRPQFNVLSFSNPIFLALSLGGSISVNHRTAPSPLTMELARFAVVEAEVTRSQARITSRIEATKQFFSLAEAQDLTVRACSSLEARSNDREKMQSLISLSRITRLDVIRFEQDVNALESECVEAKAQMQAAAVGLARSLGLNEVQKELQVSTGDLSEISVNDLPGSAELISAAVESQKDFNMIGQQIAGLSTAGLKRKFHFDYFSVGYAYLKNFTGEYPDMAKQYLLGGNVGHVETGFYIPLRKTGDEKATYNFLQARFDRVQNELKDLKLTVRYEIQDNVQRAKLAAERLSIAQRKQQLAIELHALTAQRNEVGLQPSSDELWAQRDAQRAEFDRSHSELEWKRTAFTALALSDPEKLTSLQETRRQTATPLPTAQPQPKVVSTPVVVPVTPSRISIILVTPLKPAVPAQFSQPASKNALPGNAKSNTGACTAPCEQKNAVSYRPPEPLNQVLPDSIASKSAIINSNAEVHVEVSIDEEGRVVDARVPNPPANMNETLVSQSVAAAKQWKFEPAQLRGKNIPSDHTITFLFHPRS